MRDRPRHKWAARFLMALSLVTITLLTVPLSGQSAVGVEGEKSEVSATILRDRIFIDSDWLPVLLEIDNQSPTQDGVFNILLELSGSEGVDPVLWRSSFEVAAGQQLQHLLGLPLTINWYATWRNNPQLHLSATRDEKPLSVARRETEFVDSTWFQHRDPSDGNFELMTLEVRPSLNQIGAAMDWRPFTTKYSEGSDGRRRSREVAFSDSKNQIIGLEMLPQNRGALLGFDIVLLHGIDPEDVAIGQRRALTAAVDAGLMVLLLPDEKGRGLRWLPGDPVEPMVELDSDGKERVRFPVVGQKVKRLSADCVSVSQGLGRWLVLEKSSGPWQLPSAAGLRHPWHLGSARARLESGYPLQHLLEMIDIYQRPGNPMRLILILGLLYVCVLWPVIGTILKNRGKLPHMLWLQPIVGVSCLLLIFMLSTFRLGVLPRFETEVLLIRFPGESHAVVYLIDSSYSPLGGRTDFPATSTLPAIPLGVGANTKNHTLTMATDGTTQVSSIRKIRTTSHHVRCDVIEVTPTVREVFMNEGIFEGDPNKVFGKLLKSESGTKASLISFGVGDSPFHSDENADFPNARWSRGDDSAIECRGFERTTVGAFLDESTISKLGLEPDVKLTIFDARLIVHKLDPR